MKKLIVASLGLALSFASFATSSTTFNYDGSNSTFDDVLNGEEVHTEYRTESQQSTCYQNEIAGYRTVCTGGGYYGGGYYGGGYNGPRGPRGGYYGPGPGYARNCFSEPFYRTVAYSCVKNVEVPYTVKDFDVVANINVNIVSTSKKAAAEAITATLGNNGQVSLKATGSKNFLIVLKDKKEEATVSGSVKTVTGTYNVELVDASALNALAIKDLNASFTGVTFKYGSSNISSLVSTSLKIEKRRFLAKKKNLFERTLQKAEYSVNGTNADVKYANIGLDLKKGRYVFTVTSEIKAEGKLLNASQFAGQLLKTVSLKKKIK